MLSERPATCLELFSGWGSFSDAFRGCEARSIWDTVTVDRDWRTGADIHADVLDLDASDFAIEFDVVLVNPPCSTLSRANQPSEHWAGTVPISDEARREVDLARYAVELIEDLDPTFWFMESPTGGRMDEVIGSPDAKITRCQYGSPWQQPMYLWGDHPEVMKYRCCSPGDDCHQAGPNGLDSGPLRAHLRDQTRRKEVPYDLSLAVKEACEVGLGLREQSAMSPSFRSEKRPTVSPAEW